MFTGKLFLSVMLSLVGFICLYPQVKDTTEDKDDSWIYSYCNFSQFKYSFSGSPTISANYGLSKTSVENFNEFFAKPDLIELKLGYTHEQKNFKANNIIDYRFSYFYLSNISVDLSGNSSAGSGLKTDLWRAGYGYSSGYGYNLGSVAIIPYYTFSFDLSRLRMEDTPSDAGDKSTTDLFNKSFRFGNSMEGGVRFQLLPGMSLDAGYERSVIYPRLIFWEWAVGELIEVAGQSILDDYIKEVMRSSPYAVPVINFLLKNALSYGLYQFRHNEMNWPFNTAAPLTYDQFKFGVTFVL